MLAVQATPTSDGWECTVQVGEPPSTVHLMRIPTHDLERWGRQGEAPEQLARRAFEFLLSREPASQILRDFTIADIQRYFPDFDREIRR